MGRRSRKRLADERAAQAKQAPPEKAPVTTPKEAPEPIVWDQIIDQRIDTQVTLAPEPYPRFGWGDLGSGSRKVVIGLVLLVIIGVMFGLLGFSYPLLVALLSVSLGALFMKETFAHWTLWGRAVIASAGGVLATLSLPDTGKAITDADLEGYVLCALGFLVLSLGVGELLLRHPRIQGKRVRVGAYVGALTAFGISALMTVLLLGIFAETLFG